MTGMRSCNSPIALFGPHVKIVQLKTSSPLVGDFHFAHKPAITILRVAGHGDCVGLF
jgi:4-hydroxy-3-methylbut-2-en-1-yl diphosphate synthase IspG/GcpE